MANLKEIRIRISSVSSTRQITSAMKMVAASKLKKAQDAITQIRPYADKLHEILQNLGGNLENNDNVYADERDNKKVLFVLIASNKGLCGAFNANVVKRAMSSIETNDKTQLDSGNLDFISIGKKTKDILKSKNIMVKKTYESIFDQLSFEKVSEVTNTIMQDFVDHKYDKVVLVYNSFKNAGVQILTEEQFLPIKIEEPANNMQTDYIFEPNEAEIVEQLIPMSLKTQLFKAVLDSYAAEHGARMTAMHIATDNAGELIKELKLTYNKARQENITNEILEIVGGAQALEQ